MFSIVEIFMHVNIEEFSTIATFSNDHSISATNSFKECKFSNDLWHLEIRQDIPKICNQIVLYIRFSTYVQHTSTNILFLFQQPPIIVSLFPEV